MTADQIIDELKVICGTCIWIVMTGEEPGLQLDPQLIERLKSAGFMLAIETNGTVALPDGLDRITVRPKVAEHAIKQLKATDHSRSTVPSEAERHQLLVEWNDTAVDYPRDKCVHKLFEEQVARTPDAVAVVFEEQQLSYRELNERANQFAHHLIALGVGPETLVGLCLDRSAELVVSILGILKAGGAYVPLDPEHPEERTLGVIDSANLRFVITNQPFNWPSDCRVLHPDEAAGGNDANIKSPDNPEQLLYVIHTSGSTGTPKGVLVTHRNVARLFDVLRQPLGFSADDCWSFYHSPAFGYSAWEIWGALSQGGTLVILPSVKRLSGPDFMKHLRDANVTVLSLTPSAFRHHLLDGAFAEINTLPALRMIALSGEAPVGADLKKWFALIPGGRPELISTYAITETGGQVAWRMLLPSDSDASWMGNVLADTRIYLLDEALQPVPVGTPGEICVAGPGLARGYLHQPELTLQKFVQDPFGNAGETRIYRTGDRGRVRDDGTIELVGRADHQVKISGHRIELGEIENVLREHPAIAEAAVVLRQDNGADPRLVAYVVAHGGRPEIASSSETQEPAEFWPSIGEYQVYDEVLYHFMSNEPVRTSAYREALERHCKDRVVLDIGTGQDALLARYAAEAGARKVYAIEVLEDAAERARKLVAGLGMQDRIVVLSGDSAQTTLPEPVDVWTQGIIGNIGSSDGIIPIANDARRWMNPGAIAIPSQCLTYFAAVELPTKMRENPIFGPLAREYAENVFDKFGRKFDVRLCVRNFPQSQIISDKGLFEDLDFSGLIEPEFRGKHSFTVTRDACFDGFILWTYVTTTVGVSVDFLENQQAWLPIYFPMTDDGWHLKQGDSIDVEWQRVTSPNGLNPDYHIQAAVSNEIGTIRTFTHHSCHHQQSFMANGIHRRLFEGWDRNTTTPEPRQLRSHLARKLPDYMLPAAFVFLDSLPRSANGKLDRRALPSPGSLRRELDAPYRAHENPLEQALVEIWQEVLGIGGLGTDDDFFKLGGNSLQAISITNRIQGLLGEHVYVVAIFDAPTVKSLAAHLSQHYPAAISIAFPAAALPEISGSLDPGHRKLLPEDEAVMRHLLRAQDTRPLLRPPQSKNPRAVFILSTHRSGSTLFRIMLAGHPALFAPPELELLGFDTLAERKAFFSGRDSYWLEGTIRALMHLRNCPLVEAEKALTDWENQGLSVPDFYKHLQQEAAGRLLIDKSTHYALNPETLRQAEAWFEDPLYIHLLRHPCGSIQSYLDTRMEFFFRHAHQFSNAHLAELNWLVSQRNILDFLRDVPPKRQMRLRFEDLVSAPQSSLEKVCDFLGVGFHPEVLNPYGDQSVRMTDAIHVHSRMLGDVKFAGHKRIDPSIADRWKGKIEESSLGDPTWELANKFGYHHEANDAIQSAGNSRFAPISRPVDAPLVLSFAQQRLWFLEQMEGELTAYNMSSRWKLRGPLDVEALRLALEEIVQRHEPLRTTFAMLDDAPVQVIQPSGRFELPVEDLSSLAAETQAAEIQRCCRLEAEKPFKLSTDLMLRASLLHLADDEHLLLLTMHHIASDGWSLRILWRELAGLYDAYCRGAESNLRELPVQYADYAIWQRSELEGQRLEQLLQYWREQLKGVSPLELPTDHPRPARPTYRGAKHRFELPEALVSQLKLLSQTAGVTLHMTLLAAFQTLLSRYSGQLDIAVGVPVAGRSHAELEDLIGFFVNTIVLRTDLSGDPTFRELLGRVRQVSLAAYDHQDLPFEKLVEELRPERQLSRSPLFQVMFQLLNFVGEGLALPNLKVSRLDMSGEGDQAISNLDIVVALSPGADGGIIAHWSFNTALFKRETMCFLAESYRRLLEQVVEDTGTSLKHFALDDARTPLYPLTLAQRDIWIDQILHGDTPLHNIGGHVHLPGTLDIDRLRQSIQLLIQKHDSLRLQLTRSRDENGIPQQTIVPSLEVEVPLHDFRGEAEPLKAARRWMQQRFVQPFTLEGQPLVRYDVIRVADENHYCLIQYHHLIIDGWGIALLNRSLAELYTALSQGRAPDLQSPSYLDHVADNQSYLQSEQYGNHRSYWLQRYDSVPDPLLTSRTPDKDLAASDCYTVPLSRDLYQQLGILAKQYQASTFHVIIGALALYFTRTQGRDEFVIGLPVLNRSKAAFKNTAGPFTGVIPTRLQVKADASFGELLRGIAQTLRADYRRQRFPIGEINRAVKPATQHHQLYDIGLSYESHDYDAKFDAITSHSEPLLHGWEQTPLMLYVREFHAQADVKWDFVANRAYFSSQEIERLQGHLVSLLATLLTRAETPMWQLSLLSESERHRLLVEWNDTAIDYPSEKCVHELFEEQVARTPDAVAVIFEEQQLTYRELNERANQLAHYLISLGVRPETLVGLCLERSAELVVAILGILKAGGAYVPLDADLPQQRLEFMLRDSAVRYLVTQSSLLDRLPSHGCCVTCLDNEAETLKASDCSNLSSGVGADNLAYVMYTSGSTGVPKGVAIPQSAVVNFLLSMAVQPGMSSDDRLLSVTTPTFDISVLELLLPLTVGASLDVVPAPLNADGIGLADYVSKRNATVMQATPATWQMMLHSGWKGCPDLKVLCGGEALSDHLADELQQRCRQLWNMYGPTETTIWSTTRLVAGEGACGSIGRPIANTQVYVLDEHRQPLPIGVPGELYIGGAGLARGYLNRSELTAEKFVTNPFSEDADLRLYRTGDLCCWRSDGNLEFIGRIDDQVKLRGYRIELGEIEAAMNEHPLVAQCVVILREDRPGDKRLVAYCVAASDSEPKFSELRSYLQQRLPDYMLPSAFVSLDTLPLTSSGKVNRRGLPAPDDSRPELETGYVVPRNPLEEQLAAIWCEVLQLERVGVHDNFFALGGHSLLVARMVGLIDRHCRMQISIALVFRNPTIAELACCLDSSVTQQSVSLATESKFLRVLRQGKGTATLVCLGVPNGHLMLQLTQDLTILQLNTEPHLQWGIEQFADAFALEVERAAGSGPIIIVGYSYGGLNAFALAGRLRRRVGQPVELVMIEPSVPSWKHKLAHTPAESRTDRIGRHLGNLRAGGAKGWSTYMMEKVSWVVWRQKERWKRWLTIWKVKLNLPLKPGQKQFYNGSMYVRNIRNYSIENMPGDAHLLGSAEYIQKHKDFWQRAVGGECRTRLLTNNSHHLDILDPTKSNEWIGFLAELARSAKQ